MSSPRYVLESPRSRRAMLRGMDQMIGLMRPTLGPTARTVAVQGLSKTSAPEILDSAATIARRTIQLENPWEDMGGMIVRQMAWALFEEVGDGAATAAVICQALMHEANRLIAAGGDPMIMKRGIERALRVAQAELRRQSRTVELSSEIARVILGTVRDQKLADMVGEVTEAVGPDGAVLIEDSANRDTALEYRRGALEQRLPLLFPAERGRRQHQDDGTAHPLHRPLPAERGAADPGAGSVHRGG
jgi:chaperonin GroEL